MLSNQRSNVVALRDSVEQLQASFEAGRIDRFQVDLARQALYNSQSQLLTSEMFYQATLDNFKTEIGLPPELNLKIEDPLLDRLKLLAPAMEEIQLQVSERLGGLRDLREAIALADGEGAGADGLVLPNQPALAEREDEELQAALSPRVEELKEMLAAVEERVEDVHVDFRLLEEALPARRDYLKRLVKREEVRYANIDPELFSVEQLEARVAKRREDFVTIEKRLTTTFSQLTELIEKPSVSRKSLNTLIASLTQLSGQLLELSLVQASARLEAVDFSPVELTDEQALAIASVYRRDWMNARASLVDTWRLIYFNANDLMSDLDLVFSGDLGNVGDNPLDLRASRGRLRVGLEFDAPLTRLAERNTYRQSLIEYQQARRSYYQFRDGLYQGLRNTLRQIRLDEVNFELRRAAVQVAISQVDLTQLRLSEPPRPGAIPGAAVEQFNNTTARDLVQSLSDLLNVQNDFLSVWVNYEVQRLTLDADLGIMELAPNGHTDRKQHSSGNVSGEFAVQFVRSGTGGSGVRGLATCGDSHASRRRVPQRCAAGELLPAKPLPEPDDSEPEDKTTGNFRSDGSVQLVVAYSDLFDGSPRQISTKPTRKRALADSATFSAREIQARGYSASAPPTAGTLVVTSHG